MPEHARLSPSEWELWDGWMRAHRLLVQEVDRLLQHEFGISKADFSVLVTLLREGRPGLRVVDLSQSLGWEKSRVSHQLTRMEGRGLVDRSEAGASGRRTRVELTAKGRSLVERAVTRHEDNVRRYFLDPMGPDQAEALRAWSEQLIERLEPQEATDVGH